MKPALSGQEKKRKKLQENLGEENERGTTGEVLEPAVNTWNDLWCTKENFQIHLYDIRKSKSTYSKSIMS